MRLDRSRRHLSAAPAIATAVTCDGLLHAVLTAVDVKWATIASLLTTCDLYICLAYLHVS